MVAAISINDKLELLNGDNFPPRVGGDQGGATEAPIRVGLVGLGHMGRVRKRVLEHHPDLELVAICDPKVDETAGDVLMAHDYRALLDVDLDVVFVCTPNNVTAEIVVAALESGRHVFAEKPPGRDLDDVQAILAAESKHPGLKLKFGFNHRYHESVREAYAIVQNGRLGRLLWLRGIYGKSGGRGFEEVWRSKREIAGGGILLDQGIHMLDISRLFCGEFEEVKSFVDTLCWPIDVEDNAFVLLRNAEGQVAFLHSSSTQWKHTFLLEICLTGGYLTISGFETGSRSYGRETLVVARRQFEDEAFALGNPREEITYFAGDPSWQLEVDEFVSCIRNDTPVEVGSSEDARKVMELVYRIYAADPIWQSAGGVLSGSTELAEVLSKGKTARVAAHREGEL